MDIQEVIKLYNEEGLNLVEIGEKIGSSKSTISRELAKEGYIYDKALKQYIQETVNTGNNKAVNDVSRETVNTGNSKAIKTVKCTFELPEQLHRELKVKCASEGRKMVDLVKEVLEKALKSK